MADEIKPHGAAIGSISPISLGRSDLQKAEDYRKRLLEALGPVGAILTEAAQDGLTIGFMFSAPDGFKRVTLASLDITKKLC